MITNQQQGYSSYIKPIVAVIDVIIVFLFAFYSAIFSGYYIGLVVFSWFIASYFSNFYKVYRITKPVKIISLLLNQMALFAIIVFALAGYHYDLELKPKVIFKYVGLVFVAISFVKISIYFLLKKYRKTFNGNYRNVIVLGKNKQASVLEEFFKNNPAYGFKYFKTFPFNEERDLELIFKYVLDYDINELYCSISSLSDNEIHKIISFADNNLKGTVKFIPDD